MSTLSEHFLSTVESFLKESGIKPTEFGRQAVGDPSFILNLRRGRSPTLITADKIMTFIAKTEAAPIKAKQNRKNHNG
jgi:predicted transcriptional regulator